MLEQREVQPQARESQHSKRRGFALKASVRGMALSITGFKLLAFRTLKEQISVALSLGQFVLQPQETIISDCLKTH